MEKQSIVKQAKFLKTWNSDKYGTFFIHGIAFENGDFGEYMSKDQDQTKFVVGQSSTYEMTGEPGKIKIKPIAPHQQSFASGGPSVPKEPYRKDDKNRAFALSYAKDICCANLEHFKLDEMELLQLAETFNAFLNGENKKEETPPVNEDPSDQLPF